MKLKAFVIVFLLAAACQPNKDSENAKASIIAIMRGQEMAWNEGNLIAFMEPYLKSDSLIFIGSKGITYGWQRTLKNYQKGYPNQKAMGNLTFTNLVFTPAGHKHMWVAGQWTLHREQDTLSGHYTLLWQYLNGKWQILADHSS